MKICVAGKNEIAVYALEYLIDNFNFPLEDIFVCCNKTDTGVEVWQPSLKKKAQTFGIKQIGIDYLYNITNLLFISLEYDRIIDPQKFKSNRLFNIHFSLLPKYKGMYTSFFPLFYGEKVSGVTLHKIDDGIDTGDIVDQIQFDIDINDTCQNLYYKYMNYGLIIFKKNIEKLLKNNFTLALQKEINSSYFSKNSINFNAIKIDLNKTSFEIHNQIRAFIFPAYQLPKIGFEKILSTNLTNEKIQRNYFEDCGTHIILSGIDGFKIILTKS
jgi:methionyl-tRNA formyltransferase